ncbi:MAG: thiamine-phosphate kinase [Hormoscilla sp. SP12CHS1]|nr:thiamine-phosphate kinase [Hormoscilla sp. SP12CHS1]
MKISRLGEQGLLERLQRFCPQEIIGDDAAVLETSPGQQLVVTTDMLVDGVHFSDRTTPPEAAGWRAAAANLSDLAAMGAAPLGITVGLGIAGDTPVDWVERLYQGMTDCLQQYNTYIIGGDIVRSPVITLAITACGQVSTKATIRRNAAQPGNAIVVTGVHGASRAGLELLLHPELGHQLTSAERDFFINAHQRPKPRLDILPTLWEILDTQSQIRVAGMDSSDGLADAIVQICRASHVSAKITREKIPLPAALTQLVSPQQAVSWALYGGEDFELLLCLPTKTAQLLVKQLGQGAAIIGEIQSRCQDSLAPSLVYTDKTSPDEVLSLSQGFQHFRD